MFSFGIFSNPVTSSTGNLSNLGTFFTGNLIDASRIGSLLRSDDHTYSSQELIDRGIIGAAAILGGFLAYRANYRTSNSTVSNISVTTLGSVIGLTLGHIPVIYPLVRKRYQMKNEFEQLTNEINRNAATFNISQEKVNKVLARLKTCTLADAKNSNASQTLGRRNTVLKELNQIVKSHGENVSLVENLLDNLLQNNMLESCYKRQCELNALLLTTPGCKLK